MVRLNQEGSTTKPTTDCLVALYLFIRFHIHWLAFAINDANHGDTIARLHYERGIWHQKGKICRQNESKLTVPRPLSYLNMALLGYNEVEWVTVGLRNVGSDLVSLRRVSRRFNGGSWLGCTLVPMASQRNERSRSFRYSSSLFPRACGEL